MASLRQAARADMTGWERTPQPVSDALQRPSLAGMDNYPGRDATMLSAMPPQATTGDGLQRQFYGGPNLPLNRILPVARRGGA